MTILMALLNLDIVQVRTSRTRSFKQPAHALTCSYYSQAIAYIVYSVPKILLEYCTTEFARKERSANP